MQKFSKILMPMLVLATMFISACNGAATPASTSGNGKVEAAPVEFTGVIEAIDGNQWTVGGQVITVDPSVLRDGPFIVGDTVKVEAEVQADGSIVVTRVEAPGAADNSNTDNGNDANSNDDNGNDANSNNSNSNGDNGNAGNSNDDNSNGGLVFDNNGTEAFGTVDSITTDAVVIGGQTFIIANGAEFKNQVLAGDFVKVHFTLNADGTLSITEIEIWDPALLGDGNSNSNDDNGNEVNSNDDSGYDDNSNDDNGNNNSSDDDSGNDDNGGDDGGNDDGNDDGGNDNGG
jgi:hypothetical protein